MSAAVLYGDALVLADGSRAWKLLEPSWGWDALHAAAVELGADTVFYLPAADDKGLEAEPPAAGSVTVTVTGSVPAAWRWQLTTPEARPDPRVDVIDVPADLSTMAGPWGGLDARELVDVLASVGRVLGVPWGSSIGRTAERLILSTHPRAKGGVLLDRGISLPAAALDDARELPYVAWRRELLSGERARGWVHVFDQNAQYLAAWITAELGHGEPFHVDGPQFDARIVGLWRVPDLASVPLLVDAAALPRPDLERREWFTTATLARVWELAHPGDLPEIVEAWHWPRHSRFLRGAGERIRDARAAAMAELERSTVAIGAAVDEAAALEAVGRHVRADVALEAVKTLYRVETGRFAMPREQDGAPWYRPDWAATIRAQARVNLHRRICGLTSARPFAIATDALAFLSDEPDPFVFAKRAGLPVGVKLGEFHHAGSAAAALVDEHADGGLEAARTGVIMRAVDAAALAITEGAS